MARKIVIDSMSLDDLEVTTTVHEVSDEDDAFFEGVRALLKQMPQGDDITLLALKGHLVIEQLLIQMMDAGAANPMPLLKLSRLQFSARISLVESLLPPLVGARRDMWPMIRKVGEIRNDIAHQLAPRRLEEKIESFIGMYVRFFGSITSSPVHPDNRDIVTSDLYVIPREVRHGSLADKFRHALAGTAQGLAGRLAVIRSDATTAARTAVKD